MFRKMVQDAIRKHCKDRKYTELENCKVIRWNFAELRENCHNGSCLIIDADVKFKEWEGYNGANFIVHIYDNGISTDMVWFNHYINI